MNMRADETTLKFSLR